MILKQIHVKNFRAARDVQVDLGQQTVILGSNGTGKSTILRAIEKFYAPRAAIELDDFFCRKADDPIEIALTFTGFNDGEKDRFASRISNDEMTVTRIFEPDGGRNTGKYFGAAMRHPAFQEIRSISGANPKRAAYNELRKNSDYQSLETVSRADDIEGNLQAWEAEHQGSCELLPDDGQFFGFTNVGRGALQQSTSFVFIPAVRDATADATDARGAAISTLVELIVRSRLERREDVVEFQNRVQAEYEKLLSTDSLPELSGLSNDLTETLQTYYPEVLVALKWQEAQEFSLPLPSADVLLEDDGFEGPVDRKGHGLQRALIFTLLQHLARATAADAQEGTNGDDEDSAEIESEIVDVEPVIDEASDQDDPTPSSTEPFMLPGLILAIEEPELYQHPTKQRHLANVLNRLSAGSLPGVAAQTQIVFATHSSLLVSIDRFDELRLARRHIGHEGKKECKITKSSLDEVATRLETARGAPAGSYTGDVLRPRLHIIGSEIAEGFFADLALLVEGASDRAAIIAAAAQESVDLEEKGIAVLQVEGKPNLDRPAAIFSELQIPVYVVFDCDQKPDGTIEGDHLRSNSALQRLLGVEPPYDARTHVGDDFACFESKLEDTLSTEIGDAALNANIDLVREKYDLQTRKDVLKAPFAMTEVLTLVVKI